MAKAKAKADVQFAVGDNVKIPSSVEGEFLSGEVESIHDGGHLIDVRLEDGTLTTIPPAGVELDE